jgi:hypothetical protein
MDLGAVDGAKVPSPQALVEREIDGHPFSERSARRRPRWPGSFDTAGPAVKRAIDQSSSFAALRNHRKAAAANLSRLPPLSPLRFASRCPVP